MSAARKCNGKALRPYPIGLDVRVYLPADLRSGRRGFESRVGSVGEGRRCQCSVPIVGTRALMVAAAHGHTDTVRALLDAGADVNAKDVTGWPYTQQPLKVTLKSSNCYWIMARYQAKQAGSSVALRGWRKGSAIKRSCRFSRKLKLALSDSQIYEVPK